MNLIDQTDEAVIARAKKNWADHQPKRAHSVTDYAYDNKGKYEGTCLRRQAYEWMAVEPEWSFVQPKHMYRAQFGDYVENFIIDLLKDNWKIERQKRLEIKAFELHNVIHGRIDDILTKWDEGAVPGEAKPKKTICLEVKSTHGRKFVSKQFGLKENGPDQGHLNQLGMYKKWFPYEYDDVEYHLLYFSREDFNRLVFIDGKNMVLPTEFDMKYWMVLEDYLSRKILPPRNYKTNSDKGKDEFPCSWCLYVGTCYELNKYV